MPLTEVVRVSDSYLCWIGQADFSTLAARRLDERGMRHGPKLTATGFPGKEASCDPLLSHRDRSRQSIRELRETFVTGTLRAER